MTTGTITLNNSSASITGSSSAFTSELKAGDFIFTTVNGINYTLGVDSITSDTELTLTVAFNGATTSGLSFEVITRQAMVGITAQLAADTARAIRGLNYDKQNWQQILSGSGTVTVTLPDGSQYSGTAWPDITSSLSSIITSLAEKADSSDLGAYAKTTDLSVYAKTASLGEAASLDVGTTSGTVAAGNDSRLDTIDGKSGGTLTSSLLVGETQIFEHNTFASTSGATTHQGGRLTGWMSYTPGSTTDRNWQIWTEYTEGGTGFIQFYGLFGNSIAKYWTFYQDGTASAPSSWVSNSDKRIKDNITTITNPLDKMAQLRGVSWDRLDNAPSGVGLIAQSVQKLFPNSVFKSGNRTLKDGTVINDVLSPDTTGVSAALHQEAILSLMSIMKKGLTLIAGQTSDATTKSSLTELAALIPDESTYATQ